MKYGIWKVAEPQMQAVNALVGSGYAPLAAMVLASRGIADQKQALAYHGCEAELPDPYLLPDMGKAVARVGLAMTRGEKIAVFGDYDVDGITATCLLTDFLLSCGADCISYIPGRLEEGYGLNRIAIEQLAREGVKLIITVDCGITAVAEAELCRRLGVELVITDHHECKETLPEAAAVVDPCRPDSGYPHTNLSGVAVAFKLASALYGDQQEILNRYADMVCLGTVADVIPLRGENRVFVSRGLTSLRHTERLGLRALMEQCGAAQDSVTTSTIGFMLAPRINAAGRMGQIDLALDLFLTGDPQRAEEVARGLCELNRQRQQVESDIYRQAVDMLPENVPPEAIVLADENWHQGVVGIVASRIAEEFACPAFLICLDGDHGKASSRSHGGFNLFASLSRLSGLLESYGGHELAAGFTISRDQIPEFRKQVCALAADYFSDGAPRTSLDVDCAIPPELLTVSNIDSLSVLEPCGSGCPRPTLMMEKLTIERILMVGGGRHMRLRLRSGNHVLWAIYFSATPETASVAQGDVVDIAFTPQVNDYRGERTPQMNVVDIRPSCNARCGWETAGYRAMLENRLTKAQAETLIPSRTMLAAVWRYLSAAAAPTVEESPLCLCRKIVRWSGMPMELEQMMTCLDIFRDVGLLDTRQRHKYISITLTPRPGKADLNSSKTMQLLLQVKES